MIVVDSSALVAILEEEPEAGQFLQIILGDCVAYALAKSMDAPLLFKGNDFSETDVGTCA